MTTAVTPTATRLPTPPAGSVREILERPATKTRLNELLGHPDKAAKFAATLAQLVYANKALGKCDANTILAAAFKAVALDLSIDPALGQAHIVPFGDKATLIIGWRGYVQLALRTGQYANLHVDHVLEGEVRSVNRFTGEIEMGAPTSQKVAGVVAHLRLLNGFSKTIFWPSDKIEAHGKKYSKSYGRSDSGWTTHPEAMQKKSVLLALLRQYGILSIDMKQALADEAEAYDAAANVDVFENDDQGHAPLEVEAAHAEPKSEAKPDNATLDAEVQKADLAAGQKALMDKRAKEAAQRASLYQND